MDFDSNQIKPNPQSQIPEPPVIAPNQTQPAITQPPVTQNQAPASAAQVLENQSVPKKSGKLVFLVLIFLFFLFSALTSVGAYMVAYEKVKLPKKYEAVQFAVSNFIVGLPFMPKTPKFVLAKALIAQEEIKKENYDISIAVDSDYFTFVPTLSGLDFQAKGYIDYTNPKDVVFTTNAFLTKDFNIEILKPDQLVYLKINKVPSLILSIIGLDNTSFEPILGKWYVYDSAPLETDAREEMENQDIQTLNQKYIVENLDKFADETILSNLMLSEENIDGFDTYKITLNADEEMIDHLQSLSQQSSETLYTNSAYQTKLSDIVKSLSWDIYVDKESFYIRKAAVKAQIETDEVSSYNSLFLGTGSEPTGATRFNVAFSAKFSDFGKDVEIQKPDGALDWEEFTQTLTEIVLGPTYKNSLDARIKSDLQSIRTAAELYRSDCNLYPQTLLDLTHSAGSENCQNQSTISGTYLPNVPKDPDGNEYYYSVTSDRLSYDLCANLSSIEDEFNTCPNPVYNYHLTNP